MPYAPRRLATLFFVLTLTACGGGDPGSPDSGTGNPDGSSGDDGGGGGGDASTSGDAGNDAGVDASVERAPLFRNPVSTPDAELATQALRILGAPSAGATEVYCNDCHTLSRARIRHWRALSDTSLESCLTDLEVSSDASATSMLACLRGTESGNYEPNLFGIWSTAAHLPWFQYVVRHGTPTGDWMAAHTALVDAAGMPRDHAPMTQEQFDIVAEWFIRGVPMLDAVLPADPLPTECLPGVSADVFAHIDAMATEGWAARNEAAGILMHGCAGATSAAGCLATATLARDTTFGAGWETVPDGVPGAHLRVLYTTDYASAWWTRSSADGRFVAHGAASAPNLRFIDLQRGVVVGGDALYDPFFFPDDSGFIVQRGSGARICENRVLTTGTPTMLTFTESGCSSGAGIGLYEHAGTSLDGGDYWAIDGTATYDNGGQNPTRSDPAADFDAAAGSDITLMVNTGTEFMISGTERVSHRYEGDAVISPSLRMIVTRAAGASGQLGFVLRRVDVTGSGASLSVSTTEVARYCANGGKPGFSYDERFIAIHHYIGDADAVALGFTGPSDPGFAEYRTRGAANVYLIDLRTGRTIRVTNMGPGQYALFPHFRSDGWLYFTVRTESATPEHIVASDAPLLYTP